MLKEETKQHVKQVCEILRLSGVFPSPNSNPSKFLDEMEKRIPNLPSLKDCLANRKEAEQFIAGCWGAY